MILSDSPPLNDISASEMLSSLNLTSLNLTPLLESSSIIKFVGIIDIFCHLWLVVIEVCLYDSP